MSKISSLEDQALPGIKYNPKLWIAEGRSRYDTKWKNKETKWSVFLARLKNGTMTQETQAEYLKLPKGQQDKIKDIGGFVGGTLKDGHRKSDTVQSRSMLTLDLDNAPDTFVEDMMMNAEYAWAIYSTHKHSKKNPRFRLIVPLSRSVDPEAYEAIARKISEEIGMKYADPTTFQPSRLMYWGSYSRDAEYVFEYNDAELLDADAVLGRYPDWHDTSYWPLHPEELRVDKKRKEKQADPRQKPGVIGAFCRTYTIQDVIDEFLPDVYAPCGDKDDRYTYLSGSTTGGLVVYDDGMFAYSNHSTDPARGLDLNAFDLVRIHKFGEEDEDQNPDTPVTKLQSYKSMMDFASGLAPVKLELLKEREKSAKDDFAGEEDQEEADWRTQLELNKNGSVKNTLANLLLIMENDKYMKSVVYNQLSDNLEIKGPVPWEHTGNFWRDADDAQAVTYIDKHYGEFSQRNYLTALTKAADDRAYHPVREMFESLPEWDGVERVDTLLIDYLGAEDNEYTRAVIRKILCAAYVRVYHPGAKFDNMVVLNGPQGIGKSTLIAKLGGEWYSDSLNVSDMNDKTAAEKIQSFFIIEVGELAGLRKADIDKVKAFISRQDDKYRASFARRVTPHPRQCVFFGTTNSDRGYLRDVTGNRRYWNVQVTGKGLLSPWEITDAEIEQIWAEVKQKVKDGETLYLPPKIEKIAIEEQLKAMEKDDRQGLVEEYLDILLPEDWYEMSVAERRHYIANEEFRPEGTEPRKRVSNIEIWVECFGKPKEDMKQMDSYAITSIMTQIRGWEKGGAPVSVRGYGMQRVYRRR